MKKTIPSGIIVMGAMAILLGCLSLMRFVMASKEWVKDVFLGNVPFYNTFGFFLETIIGIACVLFGIGVIRLKPWARFPLQLFMLMGLIQNIIGCSGGDCMPTWIAFLIGSPFMIMKAWIVVYFGLPKVKEQFK